MPKQVCRAYGRQAITLSQQRAARAWCASQFDVPASDPVTNSSLVALSAVWGNLPRGRPWNIAAHNRSRPNPGRERTLQTTHIRPYGRPDKGRAHWAHPPRPIRKGPLSSHRARAPAFRYCRLRCFVRHARRERGRICLRRSEQQVLLVTNHARREGGASWTRVAVWRRSMVNWARKPTSAQCWVLGAFPSVAFKSQSSTSSVLRLG